MYVDTVIIKQSSTIAKPSNKGKTGTVGTRYQDPKKRKTVVQRGSHIPIDPKVYKRPYEVFDELKILELHSKPNAISALIRTFVEMSVYAYLDKFKIPSPRPDGKWTDISLSKRLELANTDLLQRNKQNSNQYKVISKLITNPRKPAHPNNMNDLIHNYNQIVSRDELIEIWDTYDAFLRLIWDEIGG